MRDRLCCLLLFLALGPLARAQDCPWLPEGRMDEAYPQMAPWSTLAGGVGRCKFISSGRRPNNVFTLTSMVKATPREAESYVRSLHDSMAKTYQASPLPALGPGGFGVRQRDDETSGFLTLVGHGGRVVVMAQLSFRARVTDAEEAVAVALAKETLAVASDPVAQKAATSCPYFDEAGLRRLLPGKDLEVQVFGETSCMAQSGKSVLVLSIVDAEDPGQTLAALTGGACRAEAVEALGPGATLSWGCTEGNPRAAVRYAEPQRVVEMHLTPGREPTAEERKGLVELARLARARHAAPPAAASPVEGAPTSKPAAAPPADVGITWKPIPAGSFTMGCTPGDKDCGNETPHAVTITRAFLMAETETTNRSYRLCVSSGACRAPKEWVGGENEPVVNVEKSDAASFCAWVGGRLPTEAEWEYAARGGRTGLIYPNASTLSHDDANFTGTGGRDKWKEVAPVKSFPPNGYGLYDMAGNVWEWVSDLPASYRPGPAVDPKGPATGDGRLNRGGSWYSFPSFLRVSYRASAGFEFRFDYGFRCVKEQVR